MSAAADWLNAAWMWKCAAEAHAFRRATKNVAQTQADELGAMLARNRGTVFGREHGFERIQRAVDYQVRVPAADYAAFAPYIDRIAAGESNVLTREKVLLLEPTSGTTGGEKLVPYTASLRAQFQRAIATWIYDLYRSRPTVRAGRAYWSISPALGAHRHSAGGISIGFADDAAYLGRFEQWAMRHVLVVPSAVARLPDIATLRYVTLLLLLAADDLSLICVWNPTFLTSLLSLLRDISDRLCHDLKHGRFTFPSSLAPEIARELARWLRPRPQRAAQVRRLLHDSNNDAECFAAFWPRLALISCWADASARLFLPALTNLFPRVEIQPKGLLATEGFVSLPLIGLEGAALAVRSHFLEFEEADENARRIRLAHQLDQGGRYRVLLTTGGGLYRYRLHDEVDVVGHSKQCPLVRFIGKVDRTSDLVGEKLAEVHVEAALARLLAVLSLRPSFVLVAPVAKATPPCYRLYVQGLSPATAEQLARDLELALNDNPYYRHAVALGQLAPLEARALSESAESGWAIYERHCLDRGQRAGDIKPTVLDRWTGWPDVFER